MEVAGTSRPASGSEHLVSHALDEVCARPQMHGLQVGTAAYLCALLQNNPSTGGLRDILVKTGFFDFGRTKSVQERRVFTGFASGAGNQTRLLYGSVRTGQL